MESKSNYQNKSNKRKNITAKNFEASNISAVTIRDRSKEIKNKLGGEI